MKNSTVMVAFLAITFFLSSCSIDDDPYGFRGEMGGERRKTSADSSEVSKPLTSVKYVYVSAIDETASSIALFRNGKRILDIPFGDDACVSPDPDMHYLIGGDIFTEYIDDSETVIKKNGEELFRAEGREILKGLLIEGDDVYSLSQKCSQKGFSFRKNGTLIMEHPSGEICGSMYDASYMRSGALYKDQDAVCFAYRSDKWHIVRDGVDNVLNIPSSVWKIYDLRLLNGTLCYLSLGSSSSSPILHIGNDYIDLSVTSAAPENGFRIYPYGSDMFFTGSFRKAGQTQAYTACWHLSGEHEDFPGSGYIFYRDEDRMAYSQYSSQNIHLYSPEIGDELLNGRYEYLSCWDADYSDDTFRVVINPKDKNKKPFLWENGERTEFEIRGRLTSVYYGY